MGRKKKEVELYSPSLTDIDTGNIIELKKEEIVPEPTIHDKYRLYINQANSGFLRGFDYPKIIEVLRWCEKKVGHGIPINSNCPACVIELVQMFGRLE